MSASKQPILNPELIHILSTQLVKCSIECPFEFNNANVEGFVFDVDFEMAFNLEDSLAKTDFKLEITTKSKEAVEQEARGSFHFVYVYKVANLKELAVPDQSNDLVLDQGLGNALASITYSTSRGILFSRLNGTAMEKFVLPVIDPDNLLQKKQGN
jgi:hypothetical protein